MEQTGISIIQTNGGITDTNGMGKPKSVGISFGPGSGLQAAKEKLKTPWLSSLMKEDATGRETITVAISEIIGTAILVFIGCTGCIEGLGINPSLLQIALTSGLGVMIAVQSVGHVSGGHLNPCITIAALILGKKSLPMTLLYTGAQCLGAMLGYGLIRVITPVELIYAGQPDSGNTFCMTELHPDLSTFQGFMAEFLATGILVLFACGVWDCRNVKNTDSIPMRFGFCITALSLIFIPFTGCSMNPARTLGPAVWNGYWSNHWIYWLGPLGGTIVVSLIYRYLFICNRREPGQFD
ncbi:hypothetical protein K0M31_015247 [Melipona bicolor]|uniref:Aquaporin n=1 Tax=Melipona bicolor TaxID=60889 RepID=A0AA40FFR9_9HYME|nr:hypothetical protein K0M31_015247 [Melipona bicolor]